MAVPGEVNDRVWPMSSLFSNNQPTVEIFGANDNEWVEVENLEKRASRNRKLEANYRFQRIQWHIKSPKLACHANGICFKVEEKILPDYPNLCVKN